MTKDLRTLRLIAITPAIALLTFANAAIASDLPEAKTQLTGTLTSPQKITRLAAIDRQSSDPLKTSLQNPTDPFLYEATLQPTSDPATTKFTLPNLLPGHTYDLIAWTIDTHGQSTRWEGITMDYHRPITPADPMTPEDRTWLENFVKDMPAFYDKSRVLHLAADHKHATLLVELARTRDFHSDKGGEIIYRTELWYFENLFGGWAKDKNTERVITRIRGNPSTLNLHLQYLPTLGAQSPSSTPISITLPEPPTTQNGLTGSPP